MGLNDYSDPNNETRWNDILDRIGLAFTAIFAVECLLKILAMGFIVHKHSYIRDPWNIIDLVAIVIGGLEFIPSLPNLKVIRTLRVVRPLRSIKALPSMRRLITSLLNSLPALANVVVFLLFVFMLFGIFGIQIFQGNFYQACRFSPEPDSNGYWPINLEVTNLQGWTQLMYDLSDSGQEIVSPIYFCLLVVIGSFFLLNLNLAVIMNEFTKVDDKFKLEMELLKQRQKLVSYSTNQQNSSLIIKHPYKRKSARVSIIGNQRRISGSGSGIGIENSHEISQSLMGQRKSALQFTKQLTVVQDIEGHQETQQQNVDYEDINSSSSEGQSISISENDCTPKHQRKKSKKNRASKQKDENNAVNKMDEIVKVTDFLRSQTAQRQRLTNQSVLQEPTLKPQSSIDIGINMNVSSLNQENFNQQPSSQVEQFSYKNEMAQSKIFLPPLKHNTLFNLYQGHQGNEKAHRKSRMAKSMNTFKRLNKSEAGQMQNKIYHKFGSINMTENEFRAINLERFSDNQIIRTESEDIKQNNSDSMIVLAKINENHSINEDKFANINSLENSRENNTQEKSINDLEMQNNEKPLNKSQIFSIQSELDPLLLRSKENLIFRVFFIISIHGLFSLFILLLILMNTVILSLDRYPIEQDEFAFLESFNDFLTFAFAGEMVIKLIGLGPKGYAQDKFNIFDCLIVVFSIAEILLQFTELGKGFTSSGAISAFRAIRLLRVFKLARSWKRMELFAYKCRLDEEGNPINLDAYNSMSTTIGASPRENFDTFLNAFTTIFIVLIGDGWNNIMYNYARSTGGPSMVFFVTLVIFGKMILMNLFLAILLRNFGEDEGKVNEGVEGTMFEKIKRKMSRVYDFVTKSRIFGSMNKIQSDKDIQSSQHNQENFDGGLSSFYQTLQKSEQSIQIRELQEKINKSIKEGLHNRQISDSSQSQNSSYKEAFEDQDQDSQRQLVLQNNESSPIEENAQQKQARVLERIQKSYREKVQNLEKRRHRKSLYVSKVGHSNDLFKQQSKKLTNWIYPYNLEKKSLWLFNKNSKVRNFFAKIVNHKGFDPFILVVITLTTVALALDNPLNDPKGKLTQILSIVDIIFTSVFIVEFVAKIITYGFAINGKQSYIINPWNALDFIIVVFSLVSIVPSGGIDFKFMKSIRMLRVVRPLRVISRNQGLKIAVLSLLNSVIGIIHVFTISFLFFLLFGIFGINYFKGQFYKCFTDHIIEKRQVGVVDKWSCLSNGGEWINQDHTFDNIIRAIKTLFEMSSTEGWTDVMWLGVDSNGIDNEPSESSNPLWVIFFMAFQLFGSLFIMNLFVGVVINTFNQEREKLGKNHLLTSFQKEWIMIQISCLKLKPMVKQERIYKNKFRNMISIISYSQRFELFILLCIIMNTICLGIEWYNQPFDVNFVLDMINYGFAIIFTIEFIMKLIAQGYKDYYTQGWNILDFFVVLGTIVSVFITFFTSSNFGASTTLIRSIRIGRVLKIVSKAGFLRKIFNTFVITLPSLANIGGLLILLIYVFSILGIFLFSEVKLQTYLDKHANFQNFYMAFMTLLRCATGEAWNYIMDDCARTFSIRFDCLPDPSYEDYVNNGYVTSGCGDPTTAYAFFMSFTMLVTMIFLNLFIAIILESFENVNQQEDLKIQDADLDIFQKSWLTYDTKGTGFIPIHKFENLMLDLIKQKSALIREGSNLVNDFVARRHFIEELELPTYMKMNYFNYQDILQSLSKAALQIDLLEGNYFNKTKDQDNVSQSSEDKWRLNQLQKIINIDSEIMSIEKKNEDNKILIVEQYNKMKYKSEEGKFKNVDQFQGNVYNSRFVFLLLQIKAKIRYLSLKKKREKEIKEKMVTSILSSMGRKRDPQHNGESPNSQSQVPSVNNSPIKEQEIVKEDLEIIQSQDPDQSSLEIQNNSQGPDSLGNARHQLKITRQKRKEFIFNKKLNSNQGSTFDTDLNSLINQLSGNQESNNSGTQSLRESEQSDVFENIKNKKQELFQSIPLEKDWMRHDPNHLNTIISEVKQEDSFSNSKIIQKSSESDNSRNMILGSPVNLVSDRVDEVQVNFHESKSPENMSQLLSQDNLLTIEKLEKEKISSPKLSPVHNQFIHLISEENQNLFIVNSRQNMKVKKEQQLTVSFGMSENQQDDQSEIKLFTYQENQKSSDQQSHRLPTFDDESPINKNESINQDSPKFIAQKKQNFSSQNQLEDQPDIKQQAKTVKNVNLRKRLTELISTKDDTSKKNQMISKLHSLLKKPNSETIKDLSLSKNKISQTNSDKKIDLSTHKVDQIQQNQNFNFNPKQNHKSHSNNQSDIIIEGSLFTDQTNSSKDQSESLIQTQ
eukprot:403333648